MIHWLDEPIIHSVLIGLIMLGSCGILWATYVRLWQLFIWEVCGEAIGTAMDHGYYLSVSPFVPMVSVQLEGRKVIWKGGLFGERMVCQNGVSRWMVTDDEISQILS